MISENFEVQFCTWYFCRWPGLPGLRDKPPQANFFRGTIFLNQSGIISNRNMPPSFCIKNPKENIFFYFFRQNLPPSFCTKNPKKIFSFSFLSKICLQRFFSFTFFFNPVQLIFPRVLTAYIFRPVLTAHIFTPVQLIFPPVLTSYIFRPVLVAYIFTLGCQYWKKI